VTLATEWKHPFGNPFDQSQVLADESQVWQSGCVAGGFFRQAFICKPNMLENLLAREMRLLKAALQSCGSSGPKV